MDNIIIIIFTSFYFIGYQKKGIKTSVRVHLENRSVFIYLILIPLHLIISHEH